MKDKTVIRQYYQKSLWIAPLFDSFIIGFIIYSVIIVVGNFVGGSGSDLGFWMALGYGLLSIMFIISMILWIQVAHFCNKKLMVDSQMTSTVTSSVLLANASYTPQVVKEGTAFLIIHYTVSKYQQVMVKAAIINQVEISDLKLGFKRVGLILLAVGVAGATGSAYLITNERAQKAWQLPLKAQEQRLETTFALANFESHAVVWDIYNSYSALHLSYADSNFEEKRTDTGNCYVNLYLLRDGKISSSDTIITYKQIPQATSEANDLKKALLAESKAMKQAKMTDNVLDNYAGIAATLSDWLIKNPIQKASEIEDDTYTISARRMESTDDYTLYVTIKVKNPK